MTTSSSPTSTTDAANTLKAASKAFRASTSPRPNSADVTTALLTLEKSAKQTRLALPLESLLGTWRLCFSAGKKAKFQSGQPVGNGFYIPGLAIAQISFLRDEANPADLQIANELRMGPLDIRFTGPARYPDKKNLLIFNFDQLRVRCFGLTLYQGALGQQKSGFAEAAIAKLPFFAFFAATEDYIAARGRGGGLAIWVRAV